MTNRRIIVAGLAGAGKTTFAERLASQLNIPHIEIDALYHGENWVPRPTFMEDITASVQADDWVVDSLGHKDSKRIIWKRANEVIWLDYSQLTIFFRVFTRSVYRVVSRKTLWNGNRETWKGWLDPEHPVQTLFRQYRARQRKIKGLIDGKNGSFTLRHFRSPREAEAWLRSEEASE